MASVENLTDDEVTIGAQAMRLEACEAEIRRMESFMKELSDALIKVRPLGGSELFVQRFGRYYADPKFCGGEIERLNRETHELRCELIKERRKHEARS